MQLAKWKSQAEALFLRFGLETTTMTRQRSQSLYSQGDPANGVFYLQRGYVKLIVLSHEGKEAVVGVLGSGSFFGHSCVTGQQVRESTAMAVSDCTVIKIEQPEILRVLREQPQFSRLFFSYLISRNAQLEADLADQLCNPCEMRLARVLLALAALDGNGGSAALLSHIDQQTLAAMVGTTQPRISVLLSRFKREGLIGYESGLQVNSGLTNIRSRRPHAGECRVVEIR